VVTGAGRGIGHAIALLLAERGGAVVVNDLGSATDGQGNDAKVADLVVDEIRSRGGKAIASHHSVATGVSASSIIDTAIGEFGRVDVVVNCAGIVRDREIWEMSEEEWDSVLRTHLYGSFYTIRAAAPYMRAAQYGRIINITSTAGLIGHYGQANYAAAKLGMVALTNMAALEMQDVNVTANSVAPFAMTRMTEATRAPGGSNVMPGANRRKTLKGVSEEVTGSVPLWRKAITADQIAPLVAYLASETSAHVTGQIFAVRGREVVLFSQPRPVRSIVFASGWTADAIGDAMSALSPSFIPLAESSDIFPYKPL
jgi:NAD(P)-dependent dehydrogenase (short-subunit alcohol dehydrogenase family)